MTVRRASEPKRHQLKNGQVMLLVILGFILLISCGTKTVDEGLVGEWRSAKHKVTVRTKDENKKFQFISDSTHTTLMIKDDLSVFGNVGSAEIENGRITTNWLLPSGMTGVAYTITCNLKGRIFENDPLESKEVEFWVGPNYEDDVWELRYTTRGAHFPMAFIFFDKQESKGEDNRL